MNWISIFKKTKSPITTRRVSLESLEGRTLMSTAIDGMVFNDTSGDGVRQVAEKGIKSAVVFLDTNLDGKRESNEPFKTTDATGSYNFSLATPGIYRVRIVLPTNNRQTSPSRGYYDIAATGSDIHVANDFGLTTTSAIRGTVFNDTNHDGKKEITEQGIAGILVYLDKNNDGKYESKSEKAYRTTTAGVYRCGNLGSSKYVIRVVLPGGVRAINPSSGAMTVKVTPGQTRSNRDFALDL